MSERKLVCVRAAVAVVCVLGLLSSSSFAQKSDRETDAPPRGTPVLWREHPNAAALDLFWGPGGRSMRPEVRVLTFIEEEKGGFSKKYRVRDGAGRVWVAKIGKEAQSETAATRLLWAAGYMTEITYLAPRARIPGKGTFRNVRFEARPSGVERAGEWKWRENPFSGTREFQGLKVMMVLLNNWDIKDENNVVLAAQGRRGTELRYAISDLGATLGDTGKWPLLWRFARSRNDPKGFSSDKLIDEIKEDGRVDFEFSGKKRGLFNDVTVEQARWAGALLSRLSDRQLADAFRAANYSRQDVRTMVSVVRSRINQLVALRRPAR
ncbi:MAG TPA: hypothetical protein VNA19_08735 [Pyrinomonadaceae bacterium]|jgi:hypothetical protein|nr:hypothetical protein [Pyrinomonadaceae bacterium]